MIIALTFATFFTSVVSGVIGMGGGILLLSVMTFFLPIHIIIPLHGLIQLRHILGGMLSHFLFAV